MPAPEPADVVEACAAPTAWLTADGRVTAANAAFAARFPRVARLADLGTGFDVEPAAVAARGPAEVQEGQAHLAPLGEGFLLQWLPPAAGAAEQKQLQLFADTVAHDLRAPLRAIDSFAKVLEDRSAEKLDATERMHLSRIRGATARMAALLAALGELSRAGSTGLRIAPLDLSVLAEWVLAELQDAEPGRRVAVEVTPGLSACGDERLVRQALHALLHNAWVFTRERDPARIVVQGRREGATSVLEIHDNGIGFDPAYGHKLFEPFQRLHGADRGAGHGLGLATARRIARRHGGDLAARSTPEGCVFTLTLPAPGDPC